MDVEKGPQLPETTVFIYIEYSNQYFDIKYNMRLLPLDGVDLEEYELCE